MRQVDIQIVVSEGDYDKTVRLLQNALIETGCGQGTDTAYVDQKDIVDPAQATICENLFVAQREPV
jgi:hypothetical protein